MRSFATLLTILILLGIHSPTASAQEEPDPRAEFRAFFSALKDAFEAKDVERIGSLVDSDRLWAEICATCDAPSLDPGAEWKIQAAVRKDFPREIAAGRLFRSLQGLSVEQVRLLDEGREARVVVRTVDDDGYVSKHRWWFRKSEDQWRFFDLEEIGAGLRVSAGAAAMLVAAMRGNSDFGRALPGLIAAMTAWQDGDVEEAIRILDELPEVALPGRLESVRQLLLGDVDLWNGNAEQALLHFDAAAKANPEMGLVDLARADALLDLDRGTEALASVRRYLAEYGDDPNGRIAEGRALMLLGLQKDAAVAFRKALTDAPESIEALYELVYALPEGKKQEVADWFRRHPEPVAVFWDIIDPLIEDGEREAAVALLAAFRGMAPEDHLADIAEGWLLANAGEYGKAADCYGRALKQEFDPEERAHLQMSYLDAMVRSGQALKGYQAFPGSSSAFRQVCRGLIDLEDGETILEVAKAHAKELPDDLWLQFHRGKGLSLNGDHEGAEQALAAGMARVADDDTREEFRYARVSNLYLAGRGLSAYGLVGPRRATFRDLAELYSWDEDAESLASLVAAHAEADPKDPAVRLYQGEILWLLGEMEGMVKLLDGLQSTLAAEPDLLTQYEDRLVRGLARLGRVKEALVVAKLSTRRDDNPYFEAVVHAIAQDVEATGTVLLALQELGYDAIDFWEDEDLARALASKAFAELKKRYPEPR